MKGAVGLAVSLRYIPTDPLSNNSSFRWYLMIRDGRGKDDMNGCDDEEGIGGSRGTAVDADC